MNLICDIGNTRIKFAVTEGGEILFHEQAADEGLDLLQEILGNFPKIRQAIVSSVRKDLPRWISVLRQQLEKLVILGSATGIPLKIDYNTPETLGMDRIAAGVGAHTLYPGEELLVIDAGTAITMDRVSKDGIFLGGKISPGIRMRFEALHTFTGKLPLVEPPLSWSYPGKDTVESISSGVLEGVIMEVDSTIQALQGRDSGLRTIITGGDADFFAKKVKSIIFVHSNLNTIGLNRILEHNA